MEVNDELFKLSNQLCFPLYALSREIMGGYKPYFEAIDLTYSQYLVLMVLWDVKKDTVTGIGEKLFLDTGTITPLLKRMELKGLLERKRRQSDERVVEVSITRNGEQVKMQLCEMHSEIMKGKEEVLEDLAQLRGLTNKLLKFFKTTHSL